MPLQPSQDLEARFSVFLNPIRDLTKNWEVDIAKYLEDYLVELSEIQITFDGGVTVMNFAEAAMLIQGSATVYSKKVEFLWQMVLQMLDLLSSKRNLDLDSEETQKSGSGTGRSSKNSPILNFERVNKMPIGKNVDLKFESDAEEKKNEFKFLPAVPLHLVEKEGEKSSMHITLYLKNKEPFGNKDDYRINRSYLTPSGLLCLELPHEILQQNVGQNTESEGEANQSIAGFFGNEAPLDDEPIATSEDNEEAVPNVDMAEDDVDHGGGIENNEEVENMEVEVPENPDLGEIPAGQPVLNDEGNNIAPEGVIESEVLDHNDDGEKAVENTVETVNGRYGLRTKAAKENIVEIKLTDPLKPLDPHIETPARRPVRAGRLRRPLPCSCHKELYKKKSRTRSKALKEADNLAAKTISVEEFITKDLARLIANNNNNNSDPKLDGLNVNTKLLQELTNENKKKQEKVKKDKLKGDLPIENVELGNEKGGAEQADERATGEGAEIEDHENDDYAVPNLDFENIFDGGDNFDLPDPHQSDIETPFGIIRIGTDDEESDGNSNRTLNDSMLYEPGSDYEALVQKWVSEYIANAQEHVVSSDLVRRVNRWRKIIAPKLVEEEERRAFDIHEYGSNILSHFPSDSDGGQVPFSQVAKSEDDREVSRIFLSCLMLANTYNVHLNNTIEGPLQMDCLQLKLLSRVRHHQELDEAAAATSNNHPHARPQNTSPDINTRDKSSSPVNRNRKKRRRKNISRVSSSGEDGSEACSDDLYAPSKEPSPDLEDVSSSSSRLPRRSSTKSYSSKKLKTFSEDR